MIRAFDQQIAALVDAIWPGLGHKISLADQLGFPWAAISTSFVHLRNHVPIAHVGVIELTLVLRECRRRVGALHGVCTLPSHRGRGYARGLLEEALDFCRARYETVVLYTSLRGFYEPYGFRPIPEHCFRARVPPVAGTRRTTGRRLTTAPDDLSLLRRLLVERTAVSDQIGVLGPPELFVLAEIFEQGSLARLFYFEDLAVVASHQIVGRTLRLYDVVGREVPPLPSLLERVGADVDEVVALFRPDKVADGRVEFVGEQRETTLMVSGPFQIEPGDGMVPLAGRC